MAYLSQFEYYENNGNNPKDANWGSYQYISLDDIVNNFLLMYSGNHSLINNEERYKVLFHAKRGIQELNYDAFKEIKVLELNVSNDLRFVLPNDFVNWVRISMHKDGLLRPLSENIQVQSAKAYLQDHNNDLLFDQDGNVLEPQYSNLDWERIKNTDKSIYLDREGKYYGAYGYYVDGKWYFDYTIGGRYGLNTETANFNPTFTIDKKTGVINFSSSMANELCVLEYISDGMENGDNSSVSINKLFEAYIYAYIEYEIAKSKAGFALSPMINNTTLERMRRNKTALLRNSRIRMSNMHPSRLLMNLRGRNKMIK